MIELREYCQGTFCPCPDQGLTALLGEGGACANLIGFSCGRHDRKIESPNERPVILRCGLRMTARLVCARKIGDGAQRKTGTTEYRGGCVGVAMRCAYFTLLSGSSIWRCRILASHHARMGTRCPRLKGRRGRLDIVNFRATTGLPPGQRLRPPVVQVAGFAERR